MKKPVTIITGFLGAGKTTYLNHYLEQNSATRFAIIENEFGEQGIDSELVVRPDETIVELNNGCLCCTLNDNLYDILNVLFDRRDEFDELIIEATGVADPTGLAQPFVSHPLIKEHFPLQGILCLVDAEMIETHLAETEEAKSQVAFSDILLINKTDLVPEDRVDPIRQHLQRLNPLAKITTGTKAAYPELHFTHITSPLEKILHTAPAVPTNGEARHFPVARPHHHHHHEHTQDLISHTFIFDEPFAAHVLERQLYIYLMLYSSGLYRMKGLVCMDGYPGQYILQSVGKRLDIEPKRSGSNGTETPQRSVLVFIGKNLPREDIEAVLKKCLAVPTEPTGLKPGPAPPVSKKKTS
ncbi:MAG: GTP-binding protein [Bacteroidota bacterium]